MIILSSIRLVGNLIDDIIAADTQIVMKTFTTEQTERSNHQEEQKTYRPQKELFPAALLFGRRSFNRFMPFIKHRITVFVPRVLTVSYLRVAENGRIIAVSPHKKDDRAAVNEKQQWKDKQKIGLFNIGNNSRIGERDQLLDRFKAE